MDGRREAGRSSNHKTTWLTQQCSLSTWSAFLYRSLKCLSRVKTTEPLSEQINCTSRFSFSGVKPTFRIKPPSNVDGFHVALTHAPTHRHKPTNAPTQNHTARASLQRVGIQRFSVVYLRAHPCNFTYLSAYLSASSRGDFLIPEGDILKQSQL